MYFRNYRLQKMWLGQCVKTPFSEDPFTSSMINGPKHCWNLSRQQIYHIYWSLWKELSWKKFFLVIFEILGLFANILTVNDKCSVLNRDNLRQPIQMQLSKKQKTFSQFSFAFFKARSNFQHFEKKIALIAYILLKLQTVENMLR